MKKIKNFLPIEFYFLLIPSFFIFLFSIFYLKSFTITAFGIKEFFKDSFGDEAPFGILLSILLSILLISIVFKIFFISIRKKFGKKEHIIINWKYILSIFFIILLLLFVMYSLILFTSLLFSVADPVKTAEFGNIALSWDKAIFKTNPGIWLINKFSGTFIEKTLLWVYNSLFLMLSLILLFSFLFSKKAFRRLVLSFFISWIIAFPIWFLFPTLPPDLMFRLNKLNTAGLAENKAFNNFKPSIVLKQNLEFQEKVHIINLGPAKKSLPTSTFPSMHAAWGAIVAYSGIVLCPWLGIVLIPWCILNGVGAVYILEHFSVDIFLGIIIALISIVITEILLRFENKYFKDEFGLLSGFDYIRSILQKFINDIGLSKIFKKINKQS